MICSGHVYAAYDYIHRDRERERERERLENKKRMSLQALLLASMPKQKSATVFASPPVSHTSPSSRRVPSPSWPLLARIRVKRAEVPSSTARERKRRGDAPGARLPPCGPPLGGRRRPRLALRRPRRLRGLPGALPAGLQVHLSACFVRCCLLIAGLWFMHGAMLLLLMEFAGMPARTAPLACAPPIPPGPPLDLALDLARHLPYTCRHICLRVAASFEQMAPETGAKVQHSSGSRAVEKICGAAKPILWASSKIHRVVRRSFQQAAHQMLA